MAIAYNTDIVKNGLILYLDAANRKSYPGSGTSWTDITLNGKNGTLTNGPTYSASNAGGIVFDGNDDHVLLSNSFTGLSLPTGSASRTLIACFRMTNLSSVYHHVLHYGTASGDRAFGITAYPLLGTYYLANHTWSGTSYMSNGALQVNTNYFAAITYNNSSTPRNTFFLNGTFGTTAFGQGKVADYSINTGTDFELRVGTRIFAIAESLSGTVFMCQIYNRDLSRAEIVQNYQAVRDRFGV